jgi:ribonuclease R
MKIKDKIEGVIEMNSYGSAFLYPSDNRDQRIYVYKKNTKNALDKDEVTIELIQGKTRGSIEGKVVSVNKRNKTQFTGTVMKVQDYGFLVIDSRRISVDFYLNKHQAKKCEIGEKLLVEIKKWKDSKSPTCKIIKSLGMVGENDAEMDSILHEYNLKKFFTEEVEKESEEISWEISEEEIKKRKDFRNILTVTIDPESAKDFDDVV